MLLKNEGSVLPLSRNLKSIAVIGPLADSKLDILGSWAIHADRNDSITVAQGIREALPGARVDVTTGVEISRGSPTIFDEQVVPVAPTLLTPEARKAEFDHAVALARNAEVVVMVLGEAQTMNGEDASRASLALPGEQQQLLEAVAATGKPVVLVLMTGRPLDIGWAVAHVPSILNVWYPGTEGGHAVARLLLGDANPGGHLTLSWPRSAGQEPIFYNHSIAQDPENDARRYWDLPSSPQFPFGFGLSYSSFSLDGLALASPTVSKDGTIHLSVQLHNQAAISGTEVVQCYTHQRAGSAARPERELKAFRKVAVAANGTATAELEIAASELAYWSPVSHQTVLEPGVFDLWVGTNATAALHTTFTLTAQ